jgi:hypothetical protein
MAKPGAERAHHATSNVVLDQTEALLAACNDSLDRGNGIIFVEVVNNEGAEGALQVSRQLAPQGLEPSTLVINGNDNR